MFMFTKIGIIPMVSANVGCEITTEEAYQFALLRIVW